MDQDALVPSGVPSDHLQSLGCKLLSTQTTFAQRDFTGCYRFSSSRFYIFIDFDALELNFNLRSPWNVLNCTSALCSFLTLINVRAGLAILRS